MGKPHVRLTSALVVSCFSTLLAQSRVPFNDQEIFLNGANFAWVNFARDVGPGFTDFDRFETIFRDVQANGGNNMRLWLHTTGEASPQFDSNGLVTSPGEGTIEDLRQILDMAGEHNVGMMLCLWSFDMLRISNGTLITDRAMSLLTDTTYTHAYIDNALVPLVEALRGHPAIQSWEIFNEPEGMSEEFGWDFNRHVPMADIQRFVNLCAGAIHRTDPGAQVTNGAWSFLALSDIPTALSKITIDLAQLSDAEKLIIEREFELKYGVHRQAHEIIQHAQQSAALGFNYYRDDRLIAAGGDEKGTLDFYSVHYWNWMGQSISSFHNVASHWALDKPIVVGEFGMIEPFSPANIATGERFETLFANGYAGALAWSWTDTNLSTTQQMLAGMLDIKTNHPEAVTVLDPLHVNSPGEPNSFVLEQNYPNPFNPETRIRYSLGEASDVKLQVFNVRGQGVATLVNSKQPGGDYSVIFSGKSLASGIYTYRLQADKHVLLRRMLLLR